LGLEGGLVKKSLWAKKGMHFEVYICITWERVSLVCPNSKEKNRFGGKVRFTHTPNQCWSAYGLGI
jgi:hypothetical protein